MKLPSLRDANLKEERVLLRFDGDVPTDEAGKRILDDNRLKSVLPTIRYCLEQGASLTLIAHRGRPEGKSRDSLSNSLLTDYFSDALGESVEFSTQIDNGRTRSRIALLENLRFFSGEEDNESDFSHKLARYGDIFCNDAFAVSHRAHASIVGVAKLLPHFAGFQLEEEIKLLTPLKGGADSPYALVLGGAKVDDKSPVLADLSDKINLVCLGGLVAVTYLKAMDKSHGAHKVESEQVKIAQDCLLKLKSAKVKVHLPIDYRNQNKETKPIDQLTGDELMLDIGPKTQDLFHNALSKTKTIFWNGAMGKNEEPAFAKGTVSVARSIAASEAKTRIVSGGDTVGAIHAHHLQKGFTFISTGGGATLEFIAGKELPGIQVLMQ